MDKRIDRMTKKGRNRTAANKSVRAIVFGLLMLLIASWSFIGCAGEKETEEEQAQHTWESENVVLDFYIWSDEESYVKQVVDAYNSLKGREAIRLFVIPNNEHEEWLENYDNSIGADIVGLRGNANLLEMESRDELIDLSSYLRESILDITAYGNMYNEIEYEGGYYGLPTRSTYWVLYYNKQIFDAAGFSYPGNMTWEEYLDLAGALTYGSGESVVWGGYYPPWIYQISAIQEGYYLLDDDLEPIKRSIYLLNEIYKSGTHMPYENVKYRGDECRYDFEKGNIAMMVNGEWMVNMFLEDEAAGIDVPDWDIAPLPVPEDVEYGTTVGMYQFAGITSSCKYPEAAFEFLEFLCGEQGARIYARNAIIPAWVNDEIRQIYADSSGRESSNVFFEAKRIQEQPMWYGYDRLQNLFQVNAEAYLDGVLSLDDAMNEVEEKRREILGPGK